ncbi:MAG: hypothetical protein HXS46_07620 [Theionarchaea archaeon]|nr:hypothetical protein [Theionarchaea archaeon]
MDSLQRLAVPISLLVGSAAASLLFILRITLGILTVAKWVLWFPLYGTSYLSSLLWQITGLWVTGPLVFLAGVFFCAVFFVILLEKVPQKAAFIGVGMLFFIFLLITGRDAFVQFIYVPQASTLGTAVYSVKVFAEFLIGLLLLYLLLNDN